MKNFAEKSRSTVTVTNSQHLCIFYHTPSFTSLMKCDEWWWSVKRQKKYKGSTRCIVILFKYGSALFECKVVSGGGHEQWNIPPHVAGHWALRRSRPALKLNNSKSLHYANRPGSSRRWQGWAKCVMLVLRLLVTLCPTHQCECS